MNTEPGVKKIGTSVLAIFLWLITIVLGLEAIYATRGLIAMLYVRLGGDPAAVDLITPWLVLVLALVFLIFFIVTSEFHRKRVGQPASWRLFAWSIAVEGSLVLLYFLL
jgi:pilus assembly protein TadC